MLSVAGNSRWSLRLVDLSQIDDFYHLYKQKMHDKITVYTFPLVKAIAPLTLAKIQELSECCSDEDPMIFRNHWWKTEKVHGD